MGQNNRDLPNFKQHQKLLKLWVVLKVSCGCMRLNYWYCNILVLTITQLQKIKHYFYFTFINSTRVDILRIVQHRW